MLMSMRACRLSFIIVMYSYARECTSTQTTSAQNSISVRNYILLLANSKRETAPNKWRLHVQYIKVRVFVRVYVFLCAGAYD